MNVIREIKTLEVAKVDAVLGQSLKNYIFVAFVLKLAIVTCECAKLALSEFVVT